MSLESTDYLCDLLIELDKRYRGIRFVHAGPTITRLDALGEAGFEMMAQIIDTAGGGELRMHTPLPCAERIQIHLKENDAGLWDVRFEGPKTAELDVNDITGELKEMYS